MSDIKEILSGICPEIEFTEGGESLQVSVPAQKWHDFARQLHDDPRLGFDVLTAVVGMDWKESVGVMYYLTSTSRGWDILEVKVVADDVKAPLSTPYPTSGTSPVSRSGRSTISSASAL